jgi:hypothetical protein
MKTPSKVSLAEFEAMFEAVKNWGRWGADDELGTLNYITRDNVKRAAGLVKSGRSVSMAIPINTVAGPDNPHPAIHYMTQNHDILIGSSKLAFSMDSSAWSATATATPTSTRSVTSPTEDFSMEDAPPPT